MKIIIADNAGFCFGVKRAVDMTTSELSNSNKDVYSLGPLIHNPQAVEALEDKGLQTIEDVDMIKDGKIIIRAHGATRATIDKINKKSLELVDSTCPYVKSVHNKVEDFKNQGYNIVIIGDSKHPEVIGINGWCEDEAFIVNSEEEAMKLIQMDKVCVVSQTTNTQEKFESLSKIIKNKGNEVKIYNTICNATNLRQESCKEVSSIVDAMIVIGGFHSSNTNKLVEVSKKYCKNVYHIETAKELPLQILSKFNTIGITAGASTPDWIIKEVVETMENINNNETNNEANVEAKVEMNEEVNVETNEEVNVETKVDVKDEIDEENENAMNDEMMEAIEKSFTRIHRGDVIKGEVLFVTNNEVMVNINFKSDGIVNRDELSNDPDVKPKDLYKQGDKIDVYVIKIDDGEGNVVLSAKRANDFKNWDIIEKAFNDKEIVECKVVNSVKGGLAVLIYGINAFMPASQVSVNFITDLNVYKGKTLISKIIDFDKEKRRVILSRKEVERDELNLKRKYLWAEFEVDQVVEGIVQRLTDFGAFVDLGGLDGLIHISDLSWNRVKHPSEVVKVGQNVRVKILALDKEKNRISLGLKQTIEEPWIAFSNNSSIGDIVEGTVVNLMDFGAFVRLNEGVDGLLHVSQISKEHVNKPSDIFKIGDKINVKIIDINGEDKKISLSLKDTLESDEDKEGNETFVNEELETTIGDIIEKN